MRSVIRSQLVNIHVSLPAQVVSYDSSNQSVSVQPTIKREYYDEYRTRKIEQLPIINDVPVVFPGAGGFRVTFPVTAGDTVLLVFSESSLDKWLDQGGIVDPNVDYHFHLADAIAIPGLRPFSDALTDAPTDRMSVGYDGGTTIEIDNASDEVRIGSNSASALLALKADVDAINSYLTANFVTGIGHVHQCPSGGGPTTSTTDVGSVPTATGTTKTKAE